MKKPVIIGVSVISFLALAFIGYIALDFLVLNPDYARTVDRATIAKSGEEMAKNVKSVEQMMKEIDCEQYEYTWTKEDLTCEQGKKVLEDGMRTELALGEAYKKFAGTEKISKEHIENTIKLIDEYLVAIEKTRGRFSSDDADLDQQIKVIKKHRANFAEIVK